MICSSLYQGQEKEFVDNQKLMLVALLSLDHYSFDEMVAALRLKPPECSRLLARLDRLKFIELMPTTASACS